MLFYVCVFGFVAIVFCSPVSADSDYIAACDAVFSPDAMKVSCCDLMDEFVTKINHCKKESCADEYTCSVAKCALQPYGLLSPDNTTIVESKVRNLLKRLIKEDPNTKPLYDEEEKNCLNGQYKQYVTTDPECDVLKYLVCAFVNNLLGCQKYRESPCECKTLSENATTCKPHLQEYLKQKNAC